VNWDKIIDISTRHEALPLVYHNLSRLGFQNIIPEEVFLTMKKYYYANLSKNLFFEKEMLDIFAMANQDNIGVIPFKGFSLIHTVYNNPGLRPMVDVDILVKENDLTNIKSILNKSGYEDNSEKARCNEQQFEIVFTKKIASNHYTIIEVHHELSPARPHKLNLPYLWQRARKETVDGYEIQHLSPEDTLLSLALHLRRHTRRLTLKFIIDIAELLNKHNVVMDWHYIKKSAADNHIITTMHTSLSLAKELLEAEIPLETINQFRPNTLKAFLIHLNINKNNFFNQKKRSGAFLRLLLFDKAADFILYARRVPLKLS